MYFSNVNLTCGFFRRPRRSFPSLFVWFLSFLKYTLRGQRARARSRTCLYVHKSSRIGPTDPGFTSFLPWQAHLVVSKKKEAMHLSLTLALSVMYCLFAEPREAEALRLFPVVTMNPAPAVPPTPTSHFKQVAVSATRTCPVGQQLDKNNVCRIVW